ncbi:heparan-alpha-glucosaminide N-acetyltransferase [Jannaschia sp. KMU-145]|uniref:heparan-alpha-glucosaminide N-acetyltransferase n=1 Tax=Jannaschia halovivens TaxID=3388667 RepID=UPI00396B3BB2
MTAATGDRLIAVDWLRTLALVHMVAFHFLFDLRLYGLLAPDTLGPWFALWAKGIAGSFLFLAGLSLWLAHGTVFRVRGFLTRLAVLVAAAAAVSLATYVAVPGAWVRFGILHSIALASVLALPILRAPWWLTAVGAVVVLAVLPMLRSEALGGVWWLWSGLGAGPTPPMIDYEPMVPWLAPLLAGLAFGQAGGARLLRWRIPRVRWAERLAWPGRHTLAIYLIHQPVLIGLILGSVWLTG